MAELEEAGFFEDGGIGIISSCSETAGW
jgi:hypothetical protein